MSKIYLAGPEVFMPNPIEIGENLKEICSEFGYKGMYPLDNQITADTPEEAAQKIFEANVSLINDANIIIANLSNFRGTEKDLSCDSGTAWECGYAAGLGKRVVAYTPDEKSIPNLVRNCLSRVLITDSLYEVMSIISKEHLKKAGMRFDWKNIYHQIPEKTKIILDPKTPEIHDADPCVAFTLGYLFAEGEKKENLEVYMSDIRSQREKWGEMDEKGNEIENFNMPANLMIACSSTIRSLAE